jgi:hypothetical protein
MSTKCSLINRDDKCRGSTREPTQKPEMQSLNLNPLRVKIETCTTRAVKD